MTEIERLQAENTALRNLAENLRPGPISEALAGVEHERAFRAAVETPVYRTGTTLFQLIEDGVSRDLLSSQIVDEARRSGHQITAELVEAVRRDFNAKLVSAEQS